MPDDEPSAGRDKRDEDELEIADLRPTSPRRAGKRRGHARRPRPTARVWRWLALGLSLALLVGVLLGGALPRAALRGLGSAPASPSPRATPATLPPTEPISAALPPTPAPPLAAPTALPGLSGVPTLGPAPASCGGEPPVLMDGFPPHRRQSIGRAPVLLGGFLGPYATLPLGPAASAVAYGWAAPYTPYGWPAPIGLVLRSGVGGGPVTLAGWDPHTGYPLWFGFIVAGEWGAPQHVVPAFELDPAHPAVPAGGWTDTETFWYGYVFLPEAGCYTLAATWPGGGWRVTVSAGAVGAGR